MADSTDDEEYEYDEQASVSEDYPDERQYPLARHEEETLVFIYLRMEYIYK